MRPRGGCPRTRSRRSRERMGSLLVAAQASIDRLFLAVGGVGCSVVLADRERRHRRPPRRALRRPTLRWLRPLDRRVWSEKFEGTNGIGTCLVEQRAVTIDRDQHFFTRNSGLFCTTAPIFDEHGDLAAALDVSSCRADLTEGFARLIASAVADAARCHRSGELPPRLSQGAHPARADRRALRVVAARRRPRRPRHRRDAGGADRARRQLGHAQAPDAGRRSHGPRRAPKATTSARPSAPCSSARSRARAATCPRRRRISICRARHSTGR